MPETSNYQISLILLVITALVAVVTAIYVGLAERGRKQVVDRMVPSGGDAADAERMVAKLLLNPEQSSASRLADWLSERMPTDLVSGERSAKKLVQAGFDGAAAPVIFGAVRVAALGIFPVLALVLGPRNDPLMFIVTAIGGVIAGVYGPSALLDRLAQNRSEKIRRAVPDALDLLVVCVEAGISLDAAMMRTSRDMFSSHPEMAMEMAQVVRRVNAGQPRDQALQTLHSRSGVDELRALVASMVQCEKLGTSIARVLRVNAESLRLKRKQRAEKRAAQAALKMVVPLAFLILPALMIVVLGPAAISFMKEMK
jgi:tight adherence protein C